MRVTRQRVPRHHLKSSVQEVQCRFRAPSPLVPRDDSGNAEGFETALGGENARVGSEADRDGLLLARGGWC